MNEQNEQKQPAPTPVHLSPLYVFVRVDKTFHYKFSE